MTVNNVEALPITITAVKTRGGWLGQVKIGERIVWESEDGDVYEKNALEEARYRVTDKLGQFLREPTELEIELAAEADEQVSA